MGKWDYQSLGIAPKLKQAGVGYTINVDGDRVHVEVEGPGIHEVFRVKATPEVAVQLQRLMESLQEIRNG